MTTATSTLSPYDRTASSISDDSTLSTHNRQTHKTNTNIEPTRLRQHLDDADLLTMKRQYANIGLREQNMMSNSADDLSQLVDHSPYHSQSFGQDYHDPDDDELHFDNGNNFEYEVDIQERLKRANENFQHDDTPVELTHRRRVSFDQIVKAVDIVPDTEDETNLNSVAKSTVPEDSSTNVTNSQNESSPHEYTVPLNDTQPKDGPTLLDQIKARQFHGGPPVGDRHTPANTTITNGSSSREDNLSSSKSNSNGNTNTQKNSEMRTKSSSLPQNSMVVAINGGFELQNEDDYTAKHSTKDSQHKSNDDKKSSTKLTPTPPSEAKQPRDPLKPEPSSRRPNSSINRPKSSDSGKRTDRNSNSSTSKSLSYKKDKSSTNNQLRPKSAGVSKSIESYIHTPSSVDFDELNRKAADKKRAELQKERRQKEEADKKRKEDLEKAKESFEKWVHDKEIERKRINEEKRMEKEEEEARQTQCEKELGELREKKYKEWIERKNHEVMRANDFRKLQADEEEITSGGSSSSIQNSNRRDDHRAFNRWLRRKYEQSKEEKRQLRNETRRLHRIQRRSIKRFQLQQDLQLAKSFGYT